MRRTAGAILLMLGACAPASDPGPSVEALRTRPFERPAPNSWKIPPGGLASSRGDERARRIGARIFETVFKPCATLPDETNKPPAASNGSIREGNLPGKDSPSHCEYSLEIVEAARPSASIKGSRIRLTRGMLRLAKTDAELAFVLTHEVAHHLLGHGSASFWKSRKSIELEADRLGLGLLAQAGYPVQAAVDLLKRMASALPSSEQPDPRYPSYQVRAATVRSMVREMAP